MNRGRVGEERGGKETDGCPLTHSTGVLKAIKVKILKLNAKGVVPKLILVEAYSLGE
jgi:hypothetical protein